MFWNVVEILNVFFVICNRSIKVKILSKENEKSLAKSHTCFSTIYLPFFESEEQLSKVLKTSINFSGSITDNNENIEAVAAFL